MDNKKKNVTLSLKSHRLASLIPSSNYIDWWGNSLENFTRKIKEIANKTDIHDEEIRWNKLMKKKHYQNIKW